MMNVLRSLAFYAVFYGLTTLLLTGTAIALVVSPRHVKPLADRWSRFHRWCVEHILRIEVRIEGQPEAEPALYAIKHESFFEAIDAATLFHNPAGFAKKELFDIPGWGGAARYYGVVPVDRAEGAKALRSMVSQARRFVAEGRPLVIWPEGTRVPHGERPPLRSGFSGIYKLVGLPVIPVAVDSGPLYQRAWKQRGTITVRFGEPVPPGLPREEMEARVHAAINALNS